MLPSTPHPQLLLGRIRSTRTRLETQIWEESPAFDASLEGHHGSPGVFLSAEQARQKSFKAIGSFPHRWGPRFSQAWFRFSLPGDMVSDYPYLRWEESSEATLYVDGLPYAGFDCEHLYWKLPEHWEELLMESVAVAKGINWYPVGVRAKVGPDGSELHAPRLFRRNEDAWHAWIDLHLMEELLRLVLRRKNPELLNSFSGKKNLVPMHHLPPLARKVIAAANTAIDVGEQEGMAAMRQALTAGLSQFPAAAHQLDGVLTGHAHLDLVWLWPERVGEAKAVHTFASMNRLMELYPEFRFGYSQPASYRAVRRQSPQLHESVLEHIRAGRWEATGALEVESDTNLSCGEGLVRSLLLGQQGFEELRGQPSSVVWLPDVFGYAGFLPQLMKEADAPCFYTQKVTWNNLHRFPFSCFRWRGIDGTEVLAHVMLSEIDSCYNGRTDIDHLVDIEETQQQSPLFNQVLIPTGFGDGGGGTTELMCERVRRLANLAEVPRLRWGSIEEFFDDLEAVRPNLPVWAGEIYLEYHRGVQTTHHRLKAAFRGLERALQTLEAVQAAGGHVADNRHAWERLVFAQFHDYIPGSSVPEVYDEGIPELESLGREAAEAATRLLTESGERDGEPECLFNPHAETVSHVFERQGKTVRLELPPLSGRPLDEATELPREAAVRGDANTLENGRLRARFGTDGTIASLEVDGQPVRLAGPAGTLLSFHDRPVNYPAWDLERYSLRHGKNLHQPTEMRFSSHGTTEARLECTFAFGEGNDVGITYLLRAGEPWLRIRYRVNLKEPEVLLKATFPTDYLGSQVRYGSGFGSIQRPQLGEALATDAQFEVPGARWAAIADDSANDGLWLVTRDLYGFGARDGLLHLSLVRSALVSDPNLELLQRQVEGPPVYSDLEEHELEIAIGRYHRVTSRSEHPALLAETLFTGPVHYRGPACNTALQGIEGLASLVPAWVKAAEDGRGFILRAHEVEGARGWVKPRLLPGWTARSVDIRERPLANGPDDTFAVRPYQVFSLRIEPQ